MIQFPKKKYQVIYADPPWNEAGGGKIKRGADRHYPLMKTKEIASLPVKDISDSNCHLYLWVTNNFLQDGLDVMEAWGFKYITKITWVKGQVFENSTLRLDNAGLGQYFRGQDEVCLFGRKGMIPYATRKDGKRQQGNTVIISPRREHSQKPHEMREMIEKVSANAENKIELFARERFEGWDSWGNEV